LPGRRGAFTLLELLLVLSLLVIGFAMSWPVLQGTWDDLRLRKGADQVRTVLSKARLTAVTSGQIHLFRFRLGGDQYRVSTWSGADAALDAALDAAMPSDATEDGDAYGPQLQQLPEDITFVAAPIQTNEGDLSANISELSQETGGWSSPIMFYPDGTSTDARITLQGNNGRYVAIQVRGLTGTVRTGEVTAGLDWDTDDSSR
jgi:Tfp pilus assembly protein FimT